MKIVFFKKGMTPFDNLMFQLYTEVLGEQPTLIHCGFLYGGQLIHLTLDSIVMEEYNALWKRRTSTVLVADKDTDMVLNSVRLMNVMKYRMRYVDWLQMSFRRPGRNCATFIADALFLPQYSRLFLTPDSLFEVLTKYHNYGIISNTRD